MPKATLEFNLPEEQEEHEYALNGIGYAVVIDELDTWLRNKSKYEDQTAITIEEVRTKLTELMNERGLEK